VREALTVNEQRVSLVHRHATGLASTQRQGEQRRVDNHR